MTQVSGTSQSPYLWRFLVMFLCRIRPKDSFRFVEVMTNFSVCTTVKLAVLVQLF